jgi:PST family polysaccharide transporter
VAAGYALAPAVGWPLSFWWLSRITPIPVRELVHGALRVLALTLTVAGCSQLAVLGCAGAPPALALAAAVLAGGLGYAVLVAAVPRMRADAAEVAGTIRSGLRRRGR